jgi:hypothetical protein
MAAKRSTLSRVGTTGAAALTGVARTLADPRKTRRIVAAGKIAAPVLAPLALKSVDLLRAMSDARLARKLGVDVAHVAAYRGPTGRTKARIDAVDHATRQLRERRSGNQDVVRFTDRAFRTLADLSTATQTAAPMPIGHRRATLAAVDLELDQLESQVIGYLVRTGG